MDGLLSFLKPTNDVVKILIVDGIDLECHLNRMVPNAKVDIISLNSLWNSKTDFINNYYDYVIIDDLLKNVSDIQNILYRINTMLKFDGCLLSTIGKYCYWNNIQRYAMVSSAAKFREVIVLEGDDTYWIKAIKFRQAIIELKKKYTPQLRKDLFNILHRIEYGIDVNKNTIELAVLCEKNNISEEYLCKFIQNTVIHQDNIYNNVLYDTAYISYDKYSRIKYIDMTKSYQSDRKIAFIVCVNDDDWYEETKLYLQNLLVPDGYSVEIIDVRNSSSMCAGYNSAMELTDAKYKVYMHQDCFILDEKFIFNILKIFKDGSIGCIGMMGVDPLPSNAIWWTSSDRFGRVIQSNYPEEIIELNYYIESTLKDVEAVDGFIIITQYDIKWREDLFNGWHFYDMSMCHEMRMCGYRVVVPRQEEAWCMHCPSDKILDDSYEKYRNVFLQYSCNIYTK